MAAACAPLWAMSGWWFIDWRRVGSISADIGLVGGGIVAQYAG